MKIIKNKYEELQQWKPQEVLPAKRDAQCRKGEPTIDDIQKKMQRRFPFQVNTRVLSLAQKKTWPLMMYGIPDIWKHARGEGIKVAVLDTGISPHRDLSHVLRRGFNFTSSDVNDYQDRNGHGTHVAGIINQVAPLAEIFPLKVLSDQGSGDFLWISKAIMWCIHQGMDIMNLSLGSDSPHPNLERAIKIAYANDIPMICAAGNDGQEIDYPGAYPETLAIGSVGKWRQRSSFSSRGNRLDVVAPGEDIYSTYLRNEYAVLSGTSMATPFVSGVLALVLSKHRGAIHSLSPCDTVEQMREHLTRCAVDAGNAGVDKEYGWGIISPKESVEMLKIKKDRDIQRVLEDLERRK